MVQFYLCDRSREVVVGIFVALGIGVVALLGAVDVFTSVDEMCRSLRRMVAFVLLVIGHGVYVK